jgi:cell division protein FtsB
MANSGINAGLESTGNPGQDTQDIMAAPCAMTAISPQGVVTSQTHENSTISPVPSPMKKSAQDMIKLLQMTVDNFKDQMDTQMRASLYSISVNDTVDVNSTIVSMRRTLQDFHKRMVVSLKDVLLRNSANSQKISVMQQHIAHLTREKNDLNQKVNKLEENLNRLTQFKEIIPDAESLEQAFKDVDDAFSEDDGPPQKKLKIAGDNQDE